jgi:hypothetical protein
MVHLTFWKFPKVIFALLDSSANDNLLALPANIWLGWKLMSVENTLVILRYGSNCDRKMFLKYKGPVVDAVKLFLLYRPQMLISIGPNNLC